MRRPLLSALVLLLLPAVALAGQVYTSGTNTLQIKMVFDPAKASKSKQRPRAIEAEYDYVAGTTNDQRLPDLRSLKIRLGGARFVGLKAFPKCDETDAATKGDRVCPDRSLVGEGTAIVELHPPDDPQAKSYLEVDVTLYNGRLDTDENGRPADPRRGLLVYTEIAGEKVALPFWAEVETKQVAHYNPEEDPAPNEDNAYAIKEIHVTIDRQSVRRGGRRIPFLAASRHCDGSWTVVTENEPYQGQAVGAGDRVSCRDA